MFKSPISYLLIAATLFVASCTPEEESPKNEYEIPTTYNFENVDYSGQSARIQMLDSLGKLMRTSREGNAVSFSDLEAIYKNTSGTLFGSDKQLFDKTFEGDRQMFLDWMQDLATISATGVAGEPGVAGVDGSYLFDSNGVELEQVIMKGLMGAVLYYQATTIYLGLDKMNVDNETVEPGKGTAMEHHWDESFGYWGVPTDFPSNTEGIKFFGSYSNQRNEQIGTNQALMDAYLKGRAAISNKDMAARDEAIDAVRANWELIVAANVIHYINGTLANIGDRPTRNHQWSEGYGFLLSLKYNDERKISLADWQTAMENMGTSPDALEVNDPNLLAVKNTLSTIYGLDAVKDIL
ncbi:DUF4856 domain-containing protein [Cytophagales bacterium LB-30]|uniref:DUF4856 domain-containing protein n=1 Tax=Shiella aurantiaca TaxID=3058365 RepID=A0ABT8F4Z5_9BACT|nr:DUF4856 domain-containing protein [Shiella aurantiaca]MDN4165296.1 DUF4856 domain-containing protein [Shiella aurantiaca]